MPRITPKLDVTTAPPRPLAVVAARVAAAAAGTFIALLALLHLVEPEIAPSWRFISEYELGRHGWLMVAAFLALAVASAALLVAVAPQVRTVGGRIGLVGLALAVPGFLLAAGFITDPITATQPTTHGQLHNTGAALAGGLDLSALLVGWSLARNTAWTARRRSLLWVSLVGAAGLAGSLGMNAMMAAAGYQFGPDLPVGWVSRFVIVAEAAWVLALARLALQPEGRAAASGTAPAPRQDATQPA